MAYSDKIKCISVALDAKPVVRGFLLSLIIALIWCGVALASHADEDYGDYDAESSSGIVNGETREPMDDTGTVPEENPRVVGDILVGDRTSQSTENEDAPPLPLMNDKEGPERVLDQLPRDTSIDTLRGYTTAHSLPARAIVPSPGLIMVHDADRSEEELLYFGFLSLTIRW